MTKFMLCESSPQAISLPPESPPPLPAQATPRLLRLQTSLFWMAHIKESHGMTCLGAGFFHSTCV